MLANCCPGASADLPLFLSLSLSLSCSVSHSLFLSLSVSVFLSLSVFLFAKCCSVLQCVAVCCSEKKVVACASC